MEMFHPLIKEWFYERFKKPVSVQTEAWEAVSSFQNILISAPTGSGKTFAAFLYGINQLLTGVWDSDYTSILYISPLKALNSDIYFNLIEPLESINKKFSSKNEPVPNMSVKLRSGDTNASERRDIFKNPPSIFITTPETFFLLLSQDRGISLLSNIKCVIVDEIHSIAESRRGTVLITSLERLQAITGGFIRIGLSATVNPADKICKYIGGYQLNDKNSLEHRPVKLIQSQTKKEFEVSIHEPIHELGIYGDRFWQSITSEIEKHMYDKRSTLIFVNTRKMSETVSRYLNANHETPVAYAHHGSLSKNLRKNVEELMRRGELKAIVATNSLELGIDVGHIEQVIFVQPPFSVSSFIQKLGRSGHKVGAVSRGICIPLTDLDVFQFQGYIDALNKNEIEKIHIPLNPLDVLSQIIISASLTGPFIAKDLFDILKMSYPYRSLAEKDYYQLVTFLTGTFKGLPVKEIRKRIDWNIEKDTVNSLDSTRLAFYSSGGTIPDRGYFALRTDDNRSIGELDEEFVWERRLGDVFIFGNRKWKIQKIDSNYVTVIPWKGRETSTVFWNAEELVSPPLPSRKMHQAITTALSTEDDSIRRTTSILKKNGLLFEKNTVYFEYTSNPSAGNIQKYLFIHTFAGGQINKALQFALQGYFAREGIQAHVFSNNRQLLISGFEQFDFSFKIISESLMPLIYSSLEKSGFFGARFREIANRFLVLPSRGFNKRLPLWVNRAKIKEFYIRIKHYKDNPVIKETWREILEDILDCGGAESFVKQIISGELKEKPVKTKSPSSLCDDSIFRLTNTLMYERDTPLPSGNSSSISLEYFHTLTKTGSISIDKVHIEDFEKKLKFLTAEYCPKDNDSLLNYIDERIIIPFQEWEMLIEIIDIENVELETIKGIYKITSEAVCGVVTSSGYGILANVFSDFFPAFSITDNKGIVTDPPKLSKSIDCPNDIDFLRYILSFYGPITESRLSELFGFSDNWIHSVVENLVAQDDNVLYSTIYSHVDEKQIVLLDVFEKLLNFKRYYTPEKLFSVSDIERALFFEFYENMNSIERIRTFIDCSFTIDEWLTSIFPIRFTTEELYLIESFIREKSIVPVCEDKKIRFSEYNSGTVFKSKIIPSRGSFSFWELNDETGLRPKELASIIKKEFLKGYISCDSLEGISKIISLKNSDLDTDESLNFNKWKQKRLIGGNWFCLAQEVKTEDDTVEVLEDEKNRVRLLLNRYGVIYTPVLATETKPYKMSRIARVLRLMELSGEIISGYFIEGVLSKQFSTKGFLTRINHDSISDKQYAGYYKEPFHQGRIQVKDEEDIQKNSPYYYSLLPDGSYLRYFKNKKCITGLSAENLQYLKGFLNSIPVEELKIEIIDETSVIEHDLLTPLLHLGAIKGRRGLRFDSYSIKE